VTNAFTENARLCFFHSSYDAEKNVVLTFTTTLSYFCLLTHFNLHDLPLKKCY